MGRRIKKSMKNWNIRAKNILKVKRLVGDVEKNLFIVHNDFLLIGFNGEVGLLGFILGKECFPISACQERSNNFIFG